MSDLIDEVAAPAVRTSAQSEAEAEFEAWFRETFHNVPGLTTEQFNHFREAADRYKARLRARES